MLDAANYVGRRHSYWQGVTYTVTCTFIFAKYKYLNYFS
jgi:hypothetical protein